MTAEQAAAAAPEFVEGDESWDESGLPFWK